MGFRMFRCYDVEFKVPATSEMCAGPTERLIE